MPFVPSAANLPLLPTPIKTVNVTIEAKIFLNEDEITAYMEWEKIPHDEAVTKLAMGKVPEPSDLKIRDIHVDLSTLA